MRLLFFALIFLFLPSGGEAVAAPKSVTYYLDGARVEQEVSAANGYVELRLPDNFAPGSLRVKPGPGGGVLRVEMVAAQQEPRRAGEIARLRERKAELLDRMAVLERREEIFSQAAKAQSGKAPRKTKANPDPVSSLQQGTDFALNQMESVYRSKRKCRKNLEEVERQLSASTKGVAAARIWLAGGKARVSYLLQDERWIPCYDLRITEEGVGELLLHARLPRCEKGVQYLVSRGTVAEGLRAQTVRGGYPTLSRYPLHAVVPAEKGSPPSRLAFTAVETGLPPGEGYLFWHGEYLGGGRFTGGGATEFSVAR
ncbi:hypothetical protein GPEL0_01r3295 [Geoanaerobacter pelophilus]|uniref:DUF4140 domain-containing protein n=1 Tax=Geoanaerobacter pelophilus TaxID=60036 RepID=A0ABQ0MMN2_9BACT|nr:hypothetical protein [Geoanaerobacter pelophilus]GAW67456.1 hypothetical protein GPEL0_01r3295 [Geoanaerobacter pelophilus]